MCRVRVMGSDGGAVADAQDWFRGLGHEISDADPEVVVEVGKAGFKIAPPDRKRQIQWAIWRMQALSERLERYV